MLCEECEVPRETALLRNSSVPGDPVVSGGGQKSGELAGVVQDGDGLSTEVVGGVLLEPPAGHLTEVESVLVALEGRHVPVH